MKKINPITELRNNPVQFLSDYYIKMAATPKTMYYISQDPHEPPKQDRKGLFDVQDFRDKDRKCYQMDSVVVPMNPKAQLDLDNIPLTVLDTGKQFMVTGQLSGCAFMLVQDRTGQLYAAHLQPSESMDSASLKKNLETRAKLNMKPNDPGLKMSRGLQRQGGRKNLHHDKPLGLKLNGRSLNSVANLRVFGKGNYDSGASGSAAVIGVLRNGRWEIYAQNQLRGLYKQLLGVFRIF